MVLADYGEPVPSSSTTTGRFGLGGLGGRWPRRRGQPSEGPAVSEAGAGSAIGSHRLTRADGPMPRGPHRPPVRRQSWQHRGHAAPGGPSRRRRPPEPVPGRRPRATALRPRAGRRPPRWSNCSGATGPSAILSSPFVRCVETVRPLADALALPVETTDELAEGHEAEALELYEPTGRARPRSSAPTGTSPSRSSTRSGAAATRPAERRLQKGEVWVIGAGAIDAGDRRSPPPARGPERVISVRNPPPVR